MLNRAVRRMVTLGLALALTAGSAFAAVETGKPAPSFTGTDFNGKTHKLEDYKGKYVVLEWLNYECPFVVRHYKSRNMQNLQKKYTDQGVIWLSIASSAKGKQGYYEATEFKKLNQEKGGHATAILLDSSGTIGQLYGAKTTPHMFIIDPQGKLIYQGAIDDRPSTDIEDNAKAKNYVSAALDKALAGKPVTNATTQAYGCSVKY